MGLDKRFESSHGGADADVGAEGRFAAEGEFGLAGVEFPRVEVQHRDGGCGRAQLADTGVHDHEREKSEIAAAGDGEIAAKDPVSGWGKFDDFAGVPPGDERRARSARHAIAVVPGDRKDGRVVRKA